MPLQTDLPADGDQRIAACEPGVASREVSGRLVGICLAQHGGEPEPENAVAEEFEPFERSLAHAARRARVGERLFEERAVGEAVAQRGLDLFQGDRAGQGYSTESKNRSKRIVLGQRQNSHALAEPSMEKNRISALPTRFSAGTKPTPLNTRLSSELSRLSPIAK